MRRPRRGRRAGRLAAMVPIAGSASVGMLNLDVDGKKVVVKLKMRRIEERGDC